MAAAVMVLAPSVAASSPVMPIVLTKDCDTDVHCTVETSSAPGVLPVGTEAFYDPQLSDPRLSSMLTLQTPGGGGTATGHCTLSWTTGLGTCTFAGGAGTLAGLHANFAVTTDLNTFVFTWTGTYHFEGGGN